MTDPQPSFEERLADADRVLLVGAGATDVVNGLPLARHAERVGLDRADVEFAALACQWWQSTDGAPDIYPLDALSGVDRPVPGAARVTPATTADRDGTERVPPETVFPATLGYECTLFGGRDGAAGLAGSLAAYVDHADVDLVVDVDCGSDSLFDGDRGSVETPLHDFLLMAAVDALDVPAVHALTGYGLDGEMPMAALDETVADLMRQGAYVGAHGVTQADVEALRRAYDRVEDPINSLVVPAATGDHATREVFGRAIAPEPLSAVVLLFDLATVAANGPASRLAGTGSLTAAEEALLDAGIRPETR